MALEVGPVHYTAIGVALMIAILTTAEIMWQNIAERATRISPIHGLSGKYSNRKSTEKWLKWMIALAFVVLLAAVAQTLIMLVK